MTDLTLEVETPDGVFFRRVLPAPPLRPGEPVGPAAEVATRAPAAIWGMPDFVFLPDLAAKGPGVRERGDALLVVGDLAASVQVKARAVEPGDERKELAWLEKVIRKGVRQARGTIRALQAEQTTMTNQRGRELPVHGASLEWLPVVVIDHPAAPALTPPADLARGCLVVLRQDWHFLFEQLKSTHAVLKYVKRVLALDEPCALGRESIRYYELAAADVAAEPGPVDERISAMGGKRYSYPLLPQAPAGHDARRVHIPLRVLMEDIARSPLDGHLLEEDRVSVLAALDQTPVGFRSELGRLLLDWMTDVRNVPAEHWKWRFRAVRDLTTPQIYWAAGSRWTELTMPAFSSYVQLRHTQFRELVPEAHELSVGVLVTTSKQRPWDTTVVAVRGDLELDPETRTSYEELWDRGAERLRPEPVPKQSST